MLFAVSALITVERKRGNGMINEFKREMKFVKILEICCECGFWLVDTFYEWFDFGWEWESRSWLVDVRSRFFISWLECWSSLWVCNVVFGAEDAFNRTITILSALVHMQAFITFDTSRITMPIVFRASVSLTDMQFLVIL